MDSSDTIQTLIDSLLVDADLLERNGRTKEAEQLRRKVEKRRRQLAQQAHKVDYLASKNKGTVDE